jgi:beta-glucanase (GH16 family)
MESVFCKNGIKIATATAALALVLTGGGRALASAPAGYNLVWSDEFNQGVGSSPSSANWAFDTGAGGWGNQELETYVTDTAHCSIISDANATDGQALQITATKDISHSRTYYHSARIKTANKVMPQYGFIEARIQLPYGQGIWPAFWALGSNNLSGVAWPNCGEQDIMENGGNSSWYAVNQGSLHGPGYSGGSCLFDQYTLSSGYFFQSYHLFQMLWAQNVVKYYVDGNLYFSRSANDVGLNSWPYNQAFYFITNVAVGGTFGGNPDSTTVFPQKMLIDYVRVYQEPTSSIPAAPTGVTATGQSNQVALAWTAVSGATAYNVYRGTSPGAEGSTPVAVQVTGTSYSDPGLGNGNTFYYKVTAVNGAGESPMSAESSAATASGITTVFKDGLSNWIGVASETSGMAINFSNPDLYFNNDSGRADRASDTVQSMVYSYSNISNFTATLYCWNAATTPSSVTWFASTDGGATYTTIATTSGSKTPNSSGNTWGYYTITPASALPAGVTNLKVQFNAGTGNGWDPELSELDITHQ